MRIYQLIKNFWDEIAAQNATKLREFFHTNAFIYWNNTNEKFTVDEFLIANCEYPGNWLSEVERIEFIGDLIISVTRVWTPDNGASFHVTSFFEFENNKILVLNEYWGDDGVAPQWRLNKNIGKPIK